VTRQAIRAGRGQADAARTMAIWACIVGVPAIATFTLVPELDLVVSRQFALGESDFSGLHSNLALFMRTMFRAIFVLCCAVAAAGLALAVFRRSTPLRLRTGQWLFLVLCLSVGPGLVVNVLLKDQWGRARPVQIVEFGGTKMFTPPLVRSDQCSRNCSFASGEAASMFTAFYSVALIAPQWSAPIMIAGTVAGLGAGLIRVSQGGHFLSDVVFAGVLIALISAGLHRLIFGRIGTGWLGLLLKAYPSRGS